MHILCIHPSHQRRNLGTRLLTTGLDLADKEGARVYIEASPQGLGLYKRLGWKVVDEFDIAFKDFGVKGPDAEVVYRHPCLMREPRSV